MNHNVRQLFTVRFKENIDMDQQHRSFKLLVLTNRINKYDNCYYVGQALGFYAESVTEFLMLLTVTMAMSIFYCI